MDGFLSTSRLSRRSALKAGGAALLASQAAFLEQIVVAPRRPAMAAGSFTDIQFEIGQFFQPNTFAGVGTYNDGAGPITAAFGPIFTLFVPATLTRTPSRADQTVLTNALAQIEANFDASASGLLIVSVSYGVPYFNRLNQTTVRANIPRLTANTNRFVLEDSPVFPTDVSSQNPGIVKDRFNVPVQLERNDVLFQFRSDSSFNLTNVLAWLQGSNDLHGRVIASPAFNGLFRFGSGRLQFMQPGMPRRVADTAAQSNPALYEYHTRINNVSSMVMGFVDQQLDSSAPTAATVTFAGVNARANLTTARAGDYFDNGSIVHFSHVIDDLYQFYQLEGQDDRHEEGEDFIERVQYMFRSNQLGSDTGVPHEGSADGFTNGGGPAFVPNVFQGTDAAMRGARNSGGTFTPNNQSLDATNPGVGRIGHEAALQRSSRAADGTPLHIRMDGPGFDSMDVPAFQLFPGAQNVPAGSNQFKLQFLIFVPTSEFFRQMRVNVAALDLQNQFGVNPDDNGLERFLTATRRQNFLTPPRRHRAFPLVELG